MSRHKTSHKPYHRSFTKNMVLLVTIISLTPMLLVSGIILNQFHTSFHEKVYAHLNELVHKHTQNIDSFLNESLNNIQFMAEACGSEQLLDESVLQKKLFQLQQNYGGVFEDLGIINEEGVQIAYAGPFKLEKAQYANAQWFNEALENPFYISDVFLGLRSSPHFIVSVKRFHQDKNLLLRATINFEAFNSLVENLRIGKTGFAFILNRKGEFQTKPHYNMLPSQKSYMNFIKAGKKTRHGIYIGEHMDTSERKDIIYLAALLKNEDWILVYQQEKGDAFSDLKSAQSVAVLIILGGALLIVVMNLILFHKAVIRIAEADKEKEKMNRQKEMMNRQVIETGKLASVGRLAAGIAHEINNPVAIMVQEAGWIEDLLEEEEFKKGKNLDEFERALKQINTQGKRCKEITYKLLSFARKTDSRIQKVRINEMIEEVVAISNKASYTRITINSYPDSNIPSIDGSPTEIQQVLLNLINNALYALEKDGGKIDITSSLEDSYVLIVVEDDGPGIPESNLDRIFEPFFTTKPVGKGNGLGLSICFGIIKKMGGQFSVQSTVDAGTRFEIRLPLKNSPEKSD
ncbi:ATP-binding protein [Desulfococcaceae bacterium HSG9]|nr:ATP-binding protein [Desulfococcaceae bacterium HSG9]